MTGSVALIGSLDSKAEEIRFLAERLEAAGIASMVIDFGILGEPPFVPDVSAGHVASRGGGDLETLRREANRAVAIDVMARGAAMVVAELHGRGRLAGVLAIGGSGGTTVGTAAMRALPLGVPKLMVSTIASGDTRPFVDIKDVTMVNAVADFAGLNPISETILTNAAAAMAGMVSARDAMSPKVPGSARLVAASMFGVTTPAVEKCRARLAAKGFTLVPFHATGVGGRTMEWLIADGYFDAVLDLTTTEWADEVVGGTLSAGPHRLEAAGRAGLPQVIAPGALDMVNFFGSGGVPERFAGRRIHRHSQDSYLMRTNVDENVEIGRRIAEKLNAATGPVTVLFPLRGMSALDIEGGPFHDPEADAALLDSLRQHCHLPVVIEPINCTINDDAFADRAVGILVAHLEHQESRHAHDQRQ